MKKRNGVRAYLIDDGVIVEGIYKNNEFFPDNLACGFSSQTIQEKDIGTILFTDRLSAEKYLK